MRLLRVLMRLLRSAMAIPLCLFSAGLLMGSWDDLMRRLQAVGVPAGVVNDTRDLFEDEQLRHREHFTWLDHPEMGPYATDYTESHLSATPGRLDRPAPLLGQDTEYALREIVGLSAEDYRELEEAGALE